MCCYVFGLFQRSCFIQLRVQKDFTDSMLSYVFEANELQIREDETVIPSGDNENM